MSYKDALSREVCYEDDTIIADSIENAIIAIKKLHLKSHKKLMKYLDKNPIGYCHPKYSEIKPPTFRIKSIMED